MKVSLTSWFAWAPGLETRDSWQKWSRAPVPLPSEGAPEAKFIPAMLRRRCSPLTRAFLTAAVGCVQADRLGMLRTVFASRHSNISESLELFESVARRQKLSPATFSHTVHNAQAGLYSIAWSNHFASSSISAQQSTWPCAWIEALTFLEREPQTPVLLVMGDVPISETFAALVDDPVAPYALGVMLESSGSGGPEVGLALRESAGPQTPAPPWPLALEFLRWWLSGDETIAMTIDQRCFEWRRNTL